MKTFEEKKQEAIARGIMPGAIIGCAKDGEHGVVAPIEKWKDDMGDLVVGDDRNGNYLFATYGRGFATVITPAPQTGGLEDGMACEPDEHMRRAIVEKADEIGISGSLGSYKDKRIGYWSKCRYLQNADGVLDVNIISPGEFYDRLCRMSKPEPPIMIGGHKVEFEKDGDIKVGCTSVDFATLEKVYNKALSMR